MNERQRDAIRFAELVLDVQVMDGPPPAGSKLARLIELDAQCQAEGRSESDFYLRAARL